MELQAALQSIHLYSPDPLQAARFYSAAYGMALTQVGDACSCQAPGRQVLLSSGPANQLHYAHFAFHTGAAWQAFASRLHADARQPLPAGFEAGQAVSLRDPDGNQMVFSAPAASSSPAPGQAPSATLQHFGLRTSQMDAMLDFYTARLGFVLSDAVRDAEGALRACFLRSDSLHHALALFFAPAACFDHQSFEAPGWDSMKAWGDRMASLRVPIVWGIGRHGPGNDVFFMVRDPDGNLAEISAEIEHCAPGRPAGLWPHEERTLNLWGKAILRS
ncbi:MAG: Glyoxalase/bleomycin resistance protein/dioxygenase [Polaromonas sp.]|nr:Glyoxalase/bleomycin resistance protein/dioxygenase [Polaromonas sp.]